MLRLRNKPRNGRPKDGETGLSLGMPPSVERVVVRGFARTQSLEIAGASGWHFACRAKKCRRVIPNEILVGRNSDGKRKRRRSPSLLRRFQICVKLVHSLHRRATTAVSTPRFQQSEKHRAPVRHTPQSRGHMNSSAANLT